MDLQQIDIQPEHYQHVQHLKQWRSPFKRYRLQTHKVKEGLLYRSLIAVLMFCFSVTFVAGCGNQALTKSVTSANLPAAPGHSSTNISGIALTPPPAQIFRPDSHTKTKPTPSSSATSTASSSQSTGTQPGGPSGPASIYYGVHVALVDMSLVSSFEANARKPVALVMWYQHWGNTDGYQNFQPGWMDAVRFHGSIPLVTWDPQNPNQGANQPTYSLQNIINGNFDSYIARWAQASKAWGHPYFLRFAPEMNGYWFPWSEQVNGNKAGQFVLAWRHVHAIFTAQGATNVTWVWSPNIDFSNSIPLGDLFPGNSYVDWGAMDGYNWGTVGAWHTWESFASLFQQTYQDMLRLTSKPLMIGETASTEQGGTKAAWITDAFTTQIPHYFPRIKAFVWFDLDKETDWRIESSSASQNAFATAMQSDYAANWYSSLNVSPIPSP